jgi:hypothetical protein
MKEIILPHRPIFGGAIGGYLHNSATNPHLLVENTLMVSTINNLIVVLLLWQRQESYSGNGFETRKVRILITKIKKKKS